MTLISPDVLNRTLAPFSHTDNVARLLAKEFSIHADGITYRPYRHGRPPRIINIDGERMINTFRPAAIKPKPGDVTQFLAFMRYLIPDDGDCHQVLRWCATLIARPEIRMRYALLLISETQGVGKTTLADSILRPLVGPWNVSSPTERQITDSKFNGWVGHRRLAIINEIYSGETRKCYDNLKGVIADDVVEVEKKFLEPYVVENWLHIVACSNSSKAIHLDDTDRRFMVPRITEELQPKQWWNEFYSWLRSGGLPAIAAWAETFFNKNSPVATGERAPETTRKAEVISETRSEGARYSYDLAVLVNALAKPVDTAGREQIPRKIVFRVGEVRAWVARMRNLSFSDNKMESPLTIRKALLAGGLLRPLRKGSGDHRIAIGGRPEELVANF